MVCVFSGQGAQFAGMGKDFAEADPEIMALYDKANGVVPFDLKKICFEGPAEELTKSNVCQPSIFVTSTACFRAYQKKNPGAVFAMAAGLSLGEWTALHIAGVLSFEDTLKILEARGRFMQEACETQPGGMISVMGATAEQLDDICAKAGIFKANLNSDAQVVLSGSKEGVAKAEAVCKEAGIKAIVLQVAGAFHSPLMQSARDKMAAVLEAAVFNAPKMPVLSNVLGGFHALDGAAIKAEMLRQITESVRWADCVKTAMSAGENTFIEFGPGKVLSGLIKRIDKGNVTLNVQDAATLEVAKV